jgi:catechol 2,3-dioxygenase-like lactoylglutathione lyase family enzyme
MSTAPGSPKWNCDFTFAADGRWADLLRTGWTLIGPGFMLQIGGIVKLEALDHVGLPVSDVDRSIEWYQRVLGLERAFEDAWGTYPAVLVANGTGVALFPADEPITPSAWGSLAHVGFRVSAQGYLDARAELEAAGIEFQERDHHAAWSLYIRDPDSHMVEISTYESLAQPRL